MSKITDWLRIVIFGYFLRRKMRIRNFVISPPDPQQDHIFWRKNSPKMPLSGCLVGPPQAEDTACLGAAQTNKTRGN
jgi:hypothetical protein